MSPSVFGMRDHFVQSSPEVGVIRFLLYCLAIRNCSPTRACLSALVCLLTYKTFFFAGLCFAELPFTVATLIFVITANGRGRIAGICSGAAAIAGYLLRTAGIALMAAWIADSLLHRHFRAAVTRALICLLPVLCWNLYIARVETASAGFAAGKVPV